jgi:hypothetical protein
VWAANDQLAAEPVEEFDFVYSAVDAVSVLKAAEA